MINVKRLWADRDFMYRYSRVIIAGVLLILLIIAATIINPTFIVSRNLRRIIYAAFPLMMVSFGQSMVLLTKGIDVSLGEVVSLTNVICVSLINLDSPFGWIGGVVAALVTGLCCGMLNGMIISKFELPPMIVTISMSIVYGGLALFVMPVPSGSMHSGFSSFLRDSVGPIPVLLIIIFIFLIVVRMLTNNTSFGKSLRAIGGNEEAAYSTGVNVFKVKVSAYAISGLLASVGGIWLAVYINSGDPTIGADISLNAVASSVIGGVSLSGANGDMIGTAFGVVIFSMISNLLNLNGISTNYQFLIEGLILVLALAASSVRDGKN